ncbi:MAG: crotonase/enoyl-CoA hydratase family protein [Myxococcota bacterium]
MTKPRVQVTIADHVHHVVLDRAEKRNAFDVQMLQEVAAAVTACDDDPGGRVTVITSHGGHFTAGLDLAEVGPAVQSGKPLFPEGGVDPLSIGARVRTKPLVIGVQGYCLTIGIEMILASDIAIAGTDTTFGQIEINRGIFPFGGATVRLPQVAGWGNAMRWLLTGDRFDATEAHRIGLVQEVVAPDEVANRALSIAKTIASRAPLGVQATLASSRQAVEHSPKQALDGLAAQARKLMATEDAAEGLQSFLERREGVFKGR